MRPRKPLSWPGGGSARFPKSGFCKDVSEKDRSERLQIMLSGEELGALDTWRFEQRMPSRAAAVRELLRRGLAAEGFLRADIGAKSQDFGVVTRPVPDDDAS